MINTDLMFLYVIGSPGSHKIGISNNVESRLRSLQDGSPIVLKIAMKVPMTKREATACEQHAHGLLKDSRARGEWFDVSEEEAIDAVKTAIDEIQNGLMTSDKKKPAYSGSSATRYRVVSPQGLIGSFRHQADAEMFAELKSKASGAFLTVVDRPHASNGKVETLVSYLSGTRYV